MKPILFLLLILLTNPALADNSEPKAEISKLAFGEIFFGDFPANDMICIRGLCPVGDRGIGIDENVMLPPTYCREKALTHFNRARISAPEYSFFDNQLFQVQFSILCKGESRLACVEEVSRGLDARYGLTLFADSSEEKDRVRRDHNTLYATDSGSLVVITVPASQGQFEPSVKIYDPTLINNARRSLNPEYTPNNELMEKLRDHRRQHQEK